MLLKIMVCHEDTHVQTEGYQDNDNYEMDVIMISLLDLSYLYEG